MLLESKHYYIDLINSSKANQFTSLYHYSGVGFKKAKVNQGIYRKTDDKLVGVLQWGCSAQEGIRLDRYVKEPITKEAYLELNRFCMADSEGKNAESESISLGIKWIKKYRPDIKLLVSYAGRKEGNYGYIYQATNWEYLGYFISNGFWLLDGEERHQITVWFRYKRHGDQTKPFMESICEMHHDVRQTWTKQFIYIQRLDKKLTCASPVLEYPKPSNEYPICVKIKIHKQDEDFLSSLVKKERKQCIFYYEKETKLFSAGVYRRNGEPRKRVAIYNEYGVLEHTTATIGEAATYGGSTLPTVTRAIESGKLSKKHFYRFYFDNEEPAETIEFDYLCEIDGVKFVKQIDIAEYCGVTKQAVSGSVKRKSKEINGYQVTWR